METNGNLPILPKEVFSGSNIKLILRSEIDA